MSATHDVFNQPPPLEHHNVFTTDAVLVEGVRREGAAWIKAKGGVVLTEAEESCVVYGMPRSVVEAGLSDASVQLEQMAQAIMDRI